MRSLCLIFLVFISICSGTFVWVTDQNEDALIANLTGSLGAWFVGTRITTSAALSSGNLNNQNLVIFGYGLVAPANALNQGILNGITAPVLATATVYLRTAGFSLGWFSGTGDVASVAVAAIGSSTQSLTTTVPASIYNTGLFNGVAKPFSSTPWYTPGGIWNRAFTWSASNGQQLDLAQSGSGTFYTVLARYPNIGASYYGSSAAKVSGPRMFFAADPLNARIPAPNDFSPSGMKMFQNAINFMYKGNLTHNVQTSLVLQELRVDSATFTITLDRPPLVGDGSYNVTFGIYNGDGSVALLSTPLIPEGSTTVSVSITGVSFKALSNMVLISYCAQTAFDGLFLNVPVQVTRRKMPLNITVTMDWGDLTDPVYSQCLGDVNHAHYFNITNLANGDTSVYKTGTTALQSQISHTGAYTFPTLMYEFDTYNLAVTFQTTCKGYLNINCTLPMPTGQVVFGGVVPVTCNLTHSSIRVTINNSPPNSFVQFTMLVTTPPSYTGPNPGPSPIGAYNQLRNGPGTGVWNSFTGIQDGAPGIPQWIPDQFFSAPGAPIGSTYNITYYALVPGYNCGSSVGVFTLPVPVDITMDCKYTINVLVASGCPNCPFPIVLKNYANGEVKSISGAQTGVEFFIPVTLNTGYDVRVDGQPVTDGSVVCNLFGGNPATGTATTPIVLTLTCAYRLMVLVTGLSASASMQFAVNNNGAVNFVTVSTNGPSILSTSITGAFSVNKTGPASGFGTCAQPIPASGIAQTYSGGINVTSTCGYQVSGQQSGLPTGATVRLFLNFPYDFIDITGNSQTAPSTFFFSKLLVDGSSFAVTADTTNDKYLCSFQTGTDIGSIMGGDVNTVRVTCTYKLYATVVGYPQPAVANTQPLILTLNGANSISITSDGRTQFPLTLGYTAVATFANAQDPHIYGGIQCTANTTTSFASLTDSQTVTFVCRHLLGLRVIGYGGSNLQVGVNLGGAVTNYPIATSSGFVPTTPFLLSSPYVVSIATQSVGSTCYIEQPATGTINAYSGPLNVTVRCNITITVNHQGLPAGQSVTVTLNGGLNMVLNGPANSLIPVTFPGTFGAPFLYTVTTTGNLAYNCSLYFPTGNSVVNVANINLICEYFVRVRVVNSPYNPTSSLSIASSGYGLTFSSDGVNTVQVTFKQTNTVSLTVAAQPNTGSTNPVQCTFDNGATSFTSAPLFDNYLVNVTCRYRVFITVTGYSGTGLRLNLDNGLELYDIPGGDGSYNFNTYVNGSVTVAVAIDASTSFCSPSLSSPVVGPAFGNGITATVTCVVDLRGNFTGLPAGIQLVLTNNGGSPITLTGPSVNPTPFAFPRVATLSTYNVAISSMPTDFNCTVYGGSNTASANVVNILVVCEYFLRISVVNYPVNAGRPLVVDVPGASQVSFVSNAVTQLTASRTFKYGTAFTLTVLQYPLFLGVKCQFALSDTLAVVMTNTSTVTLTCLYSIGGNVNGYAGGSLTLTNTQNSNSAPIPAGAMSYNFSTFIIGSYNVQLTTDASLSSCSVTNPSNSVSAATGPIYNINVFCNVFIGGHLYGLPNGIQIILLNNGGDPKTLVGANNGGDSTFNFTTQLPTGSSYSVTIQTSPTGYNCSVYNYFGVAAAHVNNVNVYCEPTVTVRINQLWSGAGQTMISLNGGNGIDTVSFLTDGTQMFARSVPRGSSPGLSINVPSVYMNCTASPPFINNIQTAMLIDINCTYAIVVSISGYTGFDLRLRTNSLTASPVLANMLTTYTMPQTVYGPYSISFFPGPTCCSLSLCTISNAVGTITAATGPSTTSVSIYCDVTIGGSIFNLYGAPLILTEQVSNQNYTPPFNPYNGAFVFPQHVATNSQYNVVAQSPNYENCTVSQGSGTAAQIIIGVNVNCEYFVGGMVRGLNGTNMVATIRYNNRNRGLTLNALVPALGNGAFPYQFPRSLTALTVYNLTLTQQPILQAPYGPSDVNCYFNTTTGPVGSAFITASSPRSDIDIQCEYSVKVVSAGAGGLIQVSIQAPANKLETISVPTNGVYYFNNKLAPGTYTIKVTQQPVGTVCNPDQPDITGPLTITIRCGIFVSVSVQYLYGYGLGLLTTMSQTTGTNALPVNTIGASGTQIVAFPLPLNLGENYTVSITSQPVTVAFGSIASPETCTLLAPFSGQISGAVIVNVTCAYWVFGTVTNQTPLDSLTLRLITGAGASLTTTDLPILATNPTLQRFGPTFTVLYGTPFSVSVVNPSAHPGQQCNVTSISSGVVSSPFVVLANCAYRVGGNVLGLSGSGLRLANNGVDIVSLTIDGAFYFPTYINNAYAVTIVQQPTNSFCVVDAFAAGAVADTVTNVNVHCKVSVNGTLTSMTGSSVSLTLQSDGVDVETIQVNSNGLWTFTQLIETNHPYSVRVSAQASSNENCTATFNSFGTATGNVRGVIVNCEYFVGGTITGFYGTAITLNEATIGPLTFSVADVNPEPFRFPRSVIKGYVYTVTIVSFPDSGVGDVSCVITGGSAAALAPVTSISIVCSFRLSFTVSGLVGSGLIVTNTLNGDFVQVPDSANGVYNFGTFLAVGASYNIRVTTLPSASTCTASVNVGVANTPVSNILVTCGVLIGGTIYNGTFQGGNPLILQIAGSGFAPVNVTQNVNGAFQFPTPVLTNATYTVSVVVAPPHETCLVTNGTGKATNNRYDVYVSCDFNECEVNYGGCDVSAGCVNLLHTGYYCSCNTGWMGSGFVCTDVNECLTNNGACESSHGVCTNTPGSRLCSCATDYFGDGLTLCHSIYDCTFASGVYKNGDCDTNAQCFTDPTKIPHCLCNHGYGGDGLTCDAVNPTASGDFITLVLFAPVDPVAYEKWQAALPSEVASVIGVSASRVYIIGGITVLNAAVSSPLTCGSVSGVYQKVSVEFAIIATSASPSAPLVATLNSRVSAVIAGTADCSTINDLPVSRTASDTPTLGPANNLLTLCDDNSYASSCGSSSGSSPIAAIAAAIIIVLIIVLIVGVLCWRKRHYGVYCCCGGDDKSKELEMREMDQSTDLHIAVGATAGASSSMSSPPSAASSRVNPAGGSSSAMSSPVAPSTGLGGGAAAPRKRKAPTTLRDLLVGDPEYIKIWKAQLQKEFSMENMNFYEAVEEYRKFKLNLERQNLAEPTIRKTLFPKAKEIMAAYVAHDVGSANVNIPENVEARLQKTFKQKFYTNDTISYIYGPDSEMSPDDDSSYPRPITPTIFDESQEVIFKLMENDSFPRFLKSREYKQLAQFSS